MADKFQLRHYDYVLQVGTLAAGSGVIRLPLPLDTDSSFIIRGRAVHANAANQGILADYFDRFTGPDQDDLADGLTRFKTQSPIYGQFGLPLPVRPPTVYPPGSTIYVDIQNQGAAPILGLELYFRGQKIFVPGTLPCKTYPPSCFARPYWFPKLITINPSAVLLNNVFQVNSYADFVLRTLSVGSFFEADNYQSLHIQLKDMDGRTYSNLPVHVDVCFGAYGSVSFGAVSAAYGNNLPPLLTPEIYIPANQFLLYDLYRADTPGSAVDVRLAFGGAQVWTR